MTSYPFRLAACATAFHLLCATAGLAQRVSLTGVLVSTSKDLLDGPIGPAFSLATPIARRVDLAVGVGRFKSKTDGTGIVCGGLINPSQCPVEPYSQKGRLSLVTIGADVHLYDSRIVALSLQPQFLWGRAQTETQGSTTGNRLFSEKGQYGFSGGLELRSFPVRRSPVGVVVGGSVGRLGGTSSNLLADGYTPFDDWYTVSSAYVGATLQWRRSR